MKQIIGLGLEKHSDYLTGLGYQILSNSFVQKICLRIVGIYKKHIKETNIENRVYKYYFNNLIKAKKLKTENISIDEKNYKDMVIYFTRYVHTESIKMLSLH